jgi:hypothetical protein
MSHLVTITKHFWPLQVVTSHFFAVTFRDITFYVVNNHLIARTIIMVKFLIIFGPPDSTLQNRYIIYSLLHKNTLIEKKQEYEQENPGKKS